MQTTDPNYIPDMLVDKVLHIYNMDRFHEKLNALNNKALRLGFNPINYVAGELVVERYKDEFGNEIVYQYWPVEIIHEGTIQLPGGWHLLAVLDHIEGLHKVLPGYVLPPIYRERGSVCQHCGVDRQRNETFVLINDDGSYIQVGRTCLGAYLGINPMRALAQVDWVKSVSDEEFGGRGDPIAYGLDNFLSHAALFIRTDGWLSRSSAKEQSYGTSTADLAWHNITEPVKSRYIAPIEADVTLGKAVGNWMRELPSRDDAKNFSDYMYNLAQIGENNYVTYKSAGFAASAINAMLKEYEESKAHEDKHYLGTVGGKLTADVKLVKSYGFPTHYGMTYKHRFITYDGSVIMWGTSKELEPGRDYNITGTVKEHTIYRGEPQTVLTRCKVF